MDYPPPCCSSLFPLRGMLLLWGCRCFAPQSMTLAEFAEYFETCTKPGHAILNMISLEFR